MIPSELAAHIARERIDARNSRDLDSTMSRYSEDAELTSPNVIRLMHDESGTVRGRDGSGITSEKGSKTRPTPRSRWQMCLPEPAA